MRRIRQLTFDDARRPTGRGGWRPRAGRPRGRKKTSHNRREPIDARHPQHITLRIARGVPSLRRRRTLAIVHRTLLAVGNTPEFRVVHFHLLGNHLQLLVEAANAEALGRAMQGFCVRLARGFNRALGRSGTVFAERYHVHALRSPTEVRNALRYVLLNGNRHELARGAKLLWFGSDHFSSGPWFNGWADDRAEHEFAGIAKPTADAQTWLLSIGWRRAGGPIDFDDTPGWRR